MAYPSGTSTSDFAKLQKSIAVLSRIFGSVDNILDAFGILHLPMPQRYGIMFGFIVFCSTVLAVVALLVMGGSFQRIKQQEASDQDGSESQAFNSPSNVRKQRCLLLEELLQGRERMQLKYNHRKRPECLEKQRRRTALTKLLLNIAPPEPVDSNDVSNSHKQQQEQPQQPQLPHKDKIDSDDKENSNNQNVDDTKAKRNDASKIYSKDESKMDEAVKKHDNTIPSSEAVSCTTTNSTATNAMVFMENYAIAYRECQDVPGGPMLHGRPEARYEAYARAYAGCGPHCSKAYRRSYSRIYESIVCADYATNDKYNELYDDRPEDIVGKHVRLEALDINRHSNDLFRLLNGAAGLENMSYDPNDVWGFQPEGPFTDVLELSKSFVFQHESNQAGFAIVNSTTDRLMGAILLTNDDPANLSVQMELPLMQPLKWEGTPHQLEACFLLLDRLFANGYRRVQISIDSQDNSKRLLCLRLGCTHECTMHKHMIVKDASRDSMIFSMINTFWEKRNGRKTLFSQLYGSATSLQLAEKTNNQHIK